VPPVAPAPPAAPPAGEDALDLRTEPPGAAIFVDGEAHGSSPALVRLTGGSHRLVLLADGRKLYKQAVLVAGTTPLSITLEAARLPAGIAGNAGLKVRCHTQGELRVLVDGADSGRQCPNETRIPVTPGMHKIGVYLPRSDETHEEPHRIAAGDHSTRIYLKY
jgi:hypothetical protein